MKIRSALLVILCIILAGCSATQIDDSYKTTTSTLPLDYLPEDLQFCQSDSDCILVDEYPITRSYCGTRAINKKYKDWYDDMIEKRKPYDNVVCEPLPKQEVRCLSNKCEVKTL